MGTQEGFGRFWGVQKEVLGLVWGKSFWATLQEPATQQVFRIVVQPGWQLWSGLLESYDSAQLLSLSSDPEETDPSSHAGVLGCLQRGLWKGSRGARPL